MNYVNIVVLPMPYNIEFKCVGGLIFDINYTRYNKFIKRKVWGNSKEQPHCENGPAIIWGDGEQYWCRYGEFHREDGPASIWPNGNQVWYLNDIVYSEKEFDEEMRRRHELRKRKNLTNAL